MTPKELLTVKTGPVVVGDAGAADDDGREAEKKPDVASAREQPVFPERHEGVPLRQTQLHRLAATRTAPTPVAGLLLGAGRLRLGGGGRRRDLEGEGRVTARVRRRRVVGRQRAVGLALLDLQRRVDESTRSCMHAHLYLLTYSLNT